MSNQKLFFSADVHGSEIVWRKWLSVSKMYDVDMVILSGDLTGKAIMPIVERKGGIYTCKLFGERKILRSEEEVLEIETIAKNAGYYPVRLTPEELEELKKNPVKLDRLFVEVIEERMREWLRLLEEKLPPNVEAVVMPGNDDSFSIDPIIKEYDRVIYPLGKSVEVFSKFEMISLDYTNPTPWNTPRECSEKELESKLKELTKLISVDWNKVICNFHCPPYNTNIDLAPKLDKNLKPVTSLLGPTVTEHVGSKAVRKFIQEFQPLIGLHGHIHEASGFDRIGNTLVLNPGSEYSSGVLNGFIIEFSEEGIKKWWKVSG